MRMLEVHFMANIKWLWSYLKKRLWVYGIAMILLTFFSILSLYVPKIMGRLVDDVVKDQKTELLTPLILALIAVTLFRTTIAYIQQYLQEKASQDVIHEIRTATYEKLNQQDFSFIDTNRTGDIMARMTRYGCCPAYDGPCHSAVCQGYSHSGLFHLDDA